MKNFLSIKEVGDVNQLVSEALALKQSGKVFNETGKTKTLGLLFLNPSLRTRMSTLRAAYNIGMNVIVLNLDKDSWQIEFEDGAIMNSSKSEHIREAAAVIAQYCDIVGIRCFPGLTNRETDYAEVVLKSFIKYCNKPVISLESATRHPLQSFADIISIAETKQRLKPKIVMTWAPHVKVLPQAVPNSFAEWAIASGAEVVITHPEGYDLNTDFTNGAVIEYHQQNALKDADYVYVKNWSAYENYGTMPPVSENWLLDKNKLAITNQAKIMHCLPVRRNVELPDEIIDGPNSIIQLQAGNRVIAAQMVLQKMIEAL